MKKARPFFLTLIVALAAISVGQHSSRSKSKAQGDQWPVLVFSSPDSEGLHRAEQAIGLPTEIVFVHHTFSVLVRPENEREARIRLKRAHLSSARGHWIIY